MRDYRIVTDEMEEKIMTKFEVYSVGSIHSSEEGGTFIQVDEN